LSRLLGANKRFIEQHVPHIGSLIREELADIVANSDVLIISTSNARVVDRVRSAVRADQIIIDLARVPLSPPWPCAVQGLCW